VGNLGYIAIIVVWAYHFVPVSSSLQITWVRECRFELPAAAIAEKIFAALVTSEH
jgi:hypothetical protein